jgi:hypothetical protein
MTAGQLRQTMPELASLTDRRLQFALQKYLNMQSSVAALKPLDRENEEEEACFLQTAPVLNCS